MYVVYNMYMMYTMAKFRDNLRDAFNRVEQGKKVVIERYGQRYKLVKDLDPSPEEQAKMDAAIDDIIKNDKPVEPKDKQPRTRTVENPDWGA